MTDNNSNFATYVRTSLQQLTPYSPGDHPGVIKLDANENPFDFPSAIKEQIIESITPQLFNRYPDPLSTQLVQAIADAYDLASEQIMVGNGSDELILNLMLTFGVGHDVVVATPTFSMYGIHARVAGANVVPVNGDKDFNFDVDGIIQAGQKAALVVLCSPNNPTGNSVPQQQLAQILTDCRCPVVVDQAYVEFGGTDYLPWLSRYPNLVILRTLSKAYGLAGLRVGYLLADPQVISWLSKVKQPFNLNVFSQLAATLVLRQRHMFGRHVQQIVAEKELLQQQLGQIAGVQIFSSDANYILFNTVFPGAKVFQGLLEKKVLVRSFSEQLLNNCLRVTIGQPHENKAFLQSLKQVMQQLAEKK